MAKDLSGAGRVAALAFVCLCTAAQAQWSFSPPVDVTAATGAKVFHHLDSAGRKGIWVSGNTVAVVWEDNRDGTPRCYVALKPLDAVAFNRERRLSGAGECFEPALAGSGDGRFIAVWEEEGAIHARAFDAAVEGPVLKLSAPTATQASLAFRGSSGVAAWAYAGGRGHPALRAARLQLAGNAVSAGAPVPVDVMEARGEQAYPSVALNADGTFVVAWEDRRAGHTLILWAHTVDGRKFTEPQRLADTRSGPVPGVGLGRGSGHMRVALAPVGPDEVAAVWLDKRDFLTGYDVFADASRDGGRTFGRDLPVQDEFGGNASQWHPAIAAADGRALVAWDDDREGNTDVFLAWAMAGRYSDNVVAAGGPGRQSDPVLAADAAGNVHLAYVEGSTPDGPTRLRYVLGRRALP